MNNMNKSNKTIRTRFAPSPTGYFHIAGLQKVLYSYALAKKHGGQYVLRIEDTDQNRKVEGTEEVIYESHKIMGLDVDESPVDGGDFGPYRQSERLDLYQKYADQLIEAGHAYYAFETKEELEQMREENRKEGRIGYTGKYRDFPLEEAKKRVEAGEDYVIRLKVPKHQTVEVEDLIMGKLSFETNNVQDYILMKSDGFPTYHLAVVVDDYLMEISHVFRGVEWIATTPVHALIYEFLGWEMPAIAHVPNILDPNGKGKLSKRNGSVALSEFFENGYLKDAIINFIIMLGWSAPIEREYGEKERELFSLDEFVELFDVKDLNKNNPIFDRQKLTWFNKQYLSNMPVADLVHEYRAWVDLYAEKNEISEELKAAILQDDSLDAKLALITTRVELLADIAPMLAFFYSAPANTDWEIKQLKRVKDNLAELKAEVLAAIEALPDNSADWTHEAWESAMRGIGDKHEVKHGDIFMILRVAIAGGPFSPPLFESLQILGKNEVLKRLA